MLQVQIAGWLHDRIVVHVVKGENDFSIHLIGALDFCHSFNNINNGDSESEL